MDELIFHISGSLELLEDQFIHPRSSIHQRSGQNRQRAAFFDLPGGSKHLARNFERPGINTAGHRSTTAAMDAVVSSRDTGDGIQQHENVLARFDHPSATLNHESRKPNMGFEVLVVRRGHYFSFH